MFVEGNRRGGAPRDHIMQALGEPGRRKALRVIETLPGYRDAPVVRLPALAAELGVDQLTCIDEGRRFPLGSFKALGGAYAVIALVLEEAGKRLGRIVEPEELNSPEVRQIAGRMTFCCATDGNHGRSVAWGAQLAGAACQIYIHAGVSQAREAAMAAYGAVMNRIDGSYDDSVELSASMAEKHGWVVVSDTAWPGYESIPLSVMQGYTVMIGQAMDMTDGLTHIFVQAGVGGMAAAVVAYAAQRRAKDAPRIIVVEPARAACLYESAKADRMVTIPHGEPTVMAMLECATPSPIAWEVLHHLADGYVTLDEREATDAMRQLANPLGCDLPVVAGESGGASLAGFIQCMRDPGAREGLKLGPKSRVLVVISEGATDPAIYQQIVGRSPQEVTQ